MEPSTGYIRDFGLLPQGRGIIQGLPPQGINLEETDHSLQGDHSPQGEWRRPLNVDLFLKGCYRYYIGKGWKNLLLSRVLNIATFIWILGLCFFIFGCVNYRFLFQMDDIVGSIRSPKGWLLWVSMTLYLIFLTREFIKSISDSVVDLAEIRPFYSEILKIGEKELETLRWEEVVSKIVVVECFRGMTDRQITARIMRRENYLLAITKETHTLDFFIFGRPLFTKTLEFSLELALIGHIFDQFDRVKEEFFHRERLPIQAALLKKRFYFLGVLSLIFSPLIFIFLALYSFFRYTEEFRNSPSSLGAKQWSLYAGYHFRGYNELPHHFENRMARSIKPTEQYLGQFANPMLSSLGRFISFVASSLVAILIVVSIIDDKLLMQGQIFGYNLLWWLTILGTVVVVSRSVCSKPETFRPQKYLNKFAKYTHPASIQGFPNNTAPERWREGAHTEEVRKEISGLFDFRIFSFFREMVSVLMAWVLLLWILPARSLELLSFFSNNTTTMEGVGSVCSFSYFKDPEEGLPSTTLLAPLFTPPNSPPMGRSDKRSLLLAPLLE